MSNGWREFIPEVTRALQRKGVSSIRDWLLQNPEATTVELGEKLGVRPILVSRLALDRARAEGWIEEFARDWLARELREGMPGGWGKGRGKLSAEFARADALGAWATAIETRVDENFRRAIVVLDERAPPGWRPAGPEDPLVVEVVRRLLAAN